MDLSVVEIFEDEVTRRLTACMHACMQTRARARARARGGGGGGGNGRRVSLLAGLRLAA